MSSFIIFASRASSLDEEKTKKSFEKFNHRVEIIYVDGDPREGVRLEKISEYTNA